MCGEEKRSIEEADDTVASDAAVSHREDDKEAEENATPLVTVVIPVHNTAAFLDQAIESAVRQSYRPIELGCYDDGSTDDSLLVLQKWQRRIAEMDDIDMYIIHSPESHKGPSSPRNQIIAAARGEYLCLLDSDDWMAEGRIEKQLAVARRNKNAIVGANFWRFPDDSTSYYTNWINSLDEDGIYAHRYRECTLICPTWFMHRSVYDAAGPFKEPADDEPHPPEDLIFFHEHLDRGGRLVKVPEPLVCYRYVPNSMSSLMSKRAMQKIRIHFLAKQVLSAWPSFTVWGAGKDGRWFVNNIPKECEAAVAAFCDIDPAKIGTTYFCQRTRRQVPIVHFSQAVPPVIICVASKRAAGELEENIASMGWKEGRDYYHFA